MKGIKYLTATICLFVGLQAQAKGGPWGLGVILANPTGFSGKYRFSEKNSLDAALGYSFGRSDNITLHSTYIWEFSESIRLDNVGISHYFGVGGTFYSRNRNDPPPFWADNRADDTLALAARGLAGLNYYFNDPAIEVFAELALNFFFVPSTHVDLGLAIGGRYYF